MSKQLQRVIEGVDPDRLLSFARALVRTRSVTVDARPEEEIAALVSRTWRDIGLEVSEQEFQPGRFNVYGTLPGSAKGPRIAYQAHMDTGVPSARCRFDPFAAVVEGEWLYGAGSMNMKHSLAAITEAARALSEGGAPFAGELALVAVGGEGSGCIGSRAAMDSGFQADMCVIGEPTEQIIVPAHTGAVQLTVITRGTLRHTSTIPQLGKGDDAIAHMREVIGVLRRAKTFTYERHPVLGAPLVCIGSVSGGQPGRPAWFAEECRCEVDIRTIPGMSAATVTADLEAAFARLKRKVPTFDVEVEVWDQSKNLLPVALDKGHQVVKLARQAYRKVTGRAPPSGLTSSHALLLHRRLLLDELRTDPYHQLRGRGVGRGNPRGAYTGQRHGQDGQGLHRNTGAGGIRVASSTGKNEDQ